MTERYTITTTEVRFVKKGGTFESDSLDFQSGTKTRTFPAGFSISAIAMAEIDTHHYLLWPVETEPCSGSVSKRGKRPHREHYQPHVLPKSTVTGRRSAPTSP